jgi:hypothetical protein
LGECDVTAFAEAAGVLAKKIFADRVKRDEDDVA